MESSVITVEAKYASQMTVAEYEAFFNLRAAAWADSDMANRLIPFSKADAAQGIYFFASIDEKVVGGARVVFDDNRGFSELPQQPPGKVAWLVNLFVLPAYRREGVAGYLVKTRCAFLAEHRPDCPYLALTIRRDAVSLYKLQFDFRFVSFTDRPYTGSALMLKHNP